MIPTSCFRGVVSVFGWIVFLLLNGQPVYSFHNTGSLVHQTGSIYQDTTTVRSFSKLKSSPVKNARTSLVTKHRQRQGCIFPKMSSGEKVTDVVGSYQVKILRSIDEISEDEWNSCALDSAGKGKENPFVLWAFFKALEDSKSAVGSVGWAPSHLSVRLRRSLPLLAVGRRSFRQIARLYQEHIGIAHRRRSALPQVAFLRRIRLCAPSPLSPRAPPFN
jgi:hypothetical protein